MALNVGLYHIRCLPVIARICSGSLLIKNKDIKKFIPIQQIPRFFCNDERENKDTQQSQNLKRIWTIPNIITMSRIVLTPMITSFIVAKNYPLAIAAIGIAGISDFVDGYIARKFNQKSNLGSLLDPIADKVLLVSIFTGEWMVGLLPGEIISIFLVKDLILILGALYKMYKIPKSNRPSSFSNLSQFQVQPSMISKVNTSLQIVLAGTALIKGGWGIIPDELFSLFCYGTCATTVLSLFSYVDGKALKGPAKNRLQSLRQRLKRKNKKK